MDTARDKARKLFIIKIIHTLVWLFFVFVIGYILYAGIFDALGVEVGIAIGLIVLEGVILILNNGSCPLTPVAAKYTDKRGDNFDIFLPNWLAKNNKLIFSSVWLLGVVLVVYRVIT